MQYIKHKYQQTLRNITAALLLLFWVFSFCGAGNLLNSFSLTDSIQEYSCYSSAAGASTVSGANVDFDSSIKKHHNFNSSFYFIIEEETSVFDQKEKLRNQGNWNSNIFQSPPEFGIPEIYAFPKLLVKDFITACLRTVVLLN